MTTSELLTTPREMALILAARSKSLRLARDWKRTTLASRAGVSPGSLKRFEETGKVSLGNLLQLVDALGRLAEFEALLQPVAARSIEELEERTERKPRRRGRR